MEPAGVIFRISTKKNPKDLATALSKALETEDTVSARAVGVAATANAVKAIILARTYVAARGLDLIVRPGFQNIESKDGYESRDGMISAVVFHCTTR